MSQGRIYQQQQQQQQHNSTTLALAQRHERREGEGLIKTTQTTIPLRQHCSAGRQTKIKYRKAQCWRRAVCCLSCRFKKRNGIINNFCARTTPRAQRREGTRSTRSTRSYGGHNKWRGASLRTTRIPFGTMNKERIAIRVACSGAVDQLTVERGEGCCEQIELVIQCIGTMYHQP